MIVDARRANAHFRSPPRGENASAAALARLRIPDGESLFFSQYDVKDFFYRLALPPALLPYFCLPELSWVE
eukprot:4041167-Alexandrium_andersonii.AAC.1